MYQAPPPQSYNPRPGATPENPNSQRPMPQQQPQHRSDGSTINSTPEANRFGSPDKAALQGYHGGYQFSSNSYQPQPGYPRQQSTYSSNNQSASYTQQPGGSGFAPSGYQQTSYQQQSGYQQQPGYQPPAGYQHQAEQPQTMAEPYLAPGEANKWRQSKDLSTQPAQQQPYAPVGQGGTGYGSCQGLSAAYPPAPAASRNAPPPTHENYSAYPQSRNYPQVPVEARQHPGYGQSSYPGYQSAPPLQQQQAPKHTGPPRPPQQQQQQYGRSPVGMAVGGDGASSVGFPAAGQDGNRAPGQAQQQMRSGAITPGGGRAETLTRNTNNRIDTAFVPRPLLSTEPGTAPKHYLTDQYTLPPPPIGNYTVIDRGTSSCRFIRCCLNQIPSVKETLKASGMPIVLACSPFAILPPQEGEVPTVNLNRGGLLVPAEAETEGVPRCVRCKAYLNPFATFPQGGGISCNFCGAFFATPSHYEPLFTEYNRVRMLQQSEEYWRDPQRAYLERVEVVRGTVDLAAPSTFAKTVVAGMAAAGGDANAAIAAVQKAEPHSTSRKAPKSLTRVPVTGSDGILRSIPPGFVFMVDASMSAQQSRFTQAALSAVRFAIESVQAPGTSVCIVMFDQSVKFFPSLKTGGTAAAAVATLGDDSNQTTTSTYHDDAGLLLQHVAVVTDINEPFVPADPRSLFLDAYENRAVLLDFIDRLPALLATENENAMHAPSNRRGRAAGNAALRACVSMLMASRCGAVRAFFGCPPDAGCGSLTPESIAREKDGTSYPLYPPADLTPFYNQLVADCVNSGISVDCFVGASANKHCGISALSYMARKTGGVTKYYGGFDCNRDYQALCCDVARLSTITGAYDCFFKLRCSRGFSVSRIYTGASIAKMDNQIDAFSDPSSFRVPRIDADTMIIFEIQHEGDLPADASAAYFQYAVLHTRLDGSRRIRVVTLPVPLTASLSTTFKYAEVEVMLAYLVRQTVHSLTCGREKWKEEIKSALVNILYAYRLNCASATSSGQLILPDALKCLPVYISGLLKSAAIRGTADVFADERDAALMALATAPLHQLLLMLYPTVYVLHRCRSVLKGENLARTGLPVTPDASAEVYLPPVVAASGERITTDGIFLIDDGVHLLCYVGCDVDEATRQELFGTPDLNMLHETFLLYDSFHGELGDRLNKAVAQIRLNKGLTFPWAPLLLVRPRTFEETRLLYKLVEDKLGTEPSYVDFLCQLHKRVHAKMEDG